MVENENLQRAEILLSEFEKKKKEKGIDVNNLPSFEEVRKKLNLSQETYEWYCMTHGIILD